MTTATELIPAPKRARASDTSKISTKSARASDTSKISTKSSAPSAAAKDRVASALASLLPQTKQLAEFHCAKINTLHSKCVRQTKRLATLAIKDFVPRSARISFELTASQLTSGHPEFIKLATKAKQLIADFQVELKATIVAAAELELSALKKECASAVLKAVVAHATIFILMKTGAPAKESDLALYATHAFSDVVLKFTNELSADEVTLIYTTASGFAAPNFTSAKPLTLPATVTLKEFLNQCKGLFVVPQEAFDAAEKTNALNLAAQQLTNMAISTQVM